MPGLGAGATSWLKKNGAGMGQMPDSGIFFGVIALGVKGSRALAVL
jgi:hypothetical protein